MRKPKLTKAQQTRLQYTADSRGHVHAHCPRPDAYRIVNLIPPSLYQPLCHPPSLPVLQALGLTALPGLISPLPLVFLSFAHLLFLFGWILTSTLSSSQPFFPFLPFSRPPHPEAQCLQVRQPPPKLSVTDVHNLNLE